MAPKSSSPVSRSAQRHGIVPAGASAATIDTLGLAWLIARRALPPATTVAGLMMAASAQGATITVGQGGCTLGEAFAAANSDSAIGNCPAGSGADTIVFPDDALFLLNPAADQQFGIPITSDVTIEGHGSTIHRPNDAEPSRIFSITPPPPPDALSFPPNPQVTIRDLTISGGSVIESSGQYVIPGGYYRTVGSGGGGLSSYRGDLFLERVTITGNTVNKPDRLSGGGGIYLNFSSLTILDSTISGNKALGANNGGGVYAVEGADITIQRGKIIDNEAIGGNAGGIHLLDSNLLTGNFRSSLRIEDSLLSGNTASSDSAVLVYGSELLEVINTTISGNSTLVDSDGNRGETGSVRVFSSMANIVNSTVSGNYAERGGAAIRLRGDTGSYITHTTVTGNSTGGFPGTSGGVYIPFDSRSVITASIISGNDGLDFSASNGGAEIQSRGGNIIGTGDNAMFDQPGDQINVIDPGLGPLENNGGDQLTHEPLPSSVAVDNFVGDCGDPFLDQRGLPRPLDGDEDGNAACDAGAVEFAPINPIIVDPDAANRVSDSRCSLVEAIDNAEAGQDNTDCLIGDINGPDIISLPPGATLTYGLAFGIANGLNALPNITTPITIEGNGATLEGRDDADFRLIHVDETGDLTINDMTLSGGAPYGSPSGDNVTSDGGAVLNNGALRLNEATVSGNSARRDGGGINNRGTLTVTDSTINGNTADGNGGGLYNFVATASLSNSTVSGNSSGLGAGGILSAYATLTVDQSTVSGNSGVSAGGIDNFNATLRMFNSTVAANDSAAGGLRNRNGTTADLRNNLIANQTSGPNCANAGAGSIGLGGTNLADDATCAGFSMDADAGTLLGALADNGGPTLTHALMPGHPGIDSVPTGGTGACSPPNADQRGVRRPLDGTNNGSQACDVGAFEYFNPDSDDDGDEIPNGYETDNDLDPFDSTGDNGANGDPDGDGLINLAESQNGAAAQLPDTDDDGLGDAIDAEPATDSNACIQDGLGDADFNFTAMSGTVTQCAADNSITVLGEPSAIIESGAILQLYSLSVSFQKGATVPEGGQVQTVIGEPVPGAAP